MIILRDGRPFGEIGTFGGGGLDWPLPQTLAGMCRTMIGYGRSEDFFNQTSGEYIEMLKNVSLQRILPGLVTDDGYSPLLPVPADLQFYLNDNPYVYPMEFQPLRTGEQTDINSTEWLYPFTIDVIKRQEPDRPPIFLSSTLANQYINGEIPIDGKALIATEAAGYDVLHETRIHSSIDPESRSVIDGQLYSENGIYLKAVGVPCHPDKGRLYGTDSAYDLHIDFDLAGVNVSEKIPQCAYLGGEKRRVEVNIAESHAFFNKPVKDKGQRFVKLVLATHGDFETWVPGWLLNTGAVEDAAWVREPKSGVEIKLRSAVIAGWDPCSGWDYEIREPKPFRKLVKPGSVYLVELRNPEESSKLIGALHGESICSEGSQGEKDGYGQVIVAGCNPETIGKDAAWLN